MSKRRDILIVFPSNIGDTLLAFPAVGVLAANYPESYFYAVASPSTEVFLRSFDQFREILVYRKDFAIREKIDFCRGLFGKFYLVADFKNSAFAYLCGAQRVTSWVRMFPDSLHLTLRNRSLIKRLVNDNTKAKPLVPFIPARRREHFRLILGNKKYVFVSIHSRSALKSYPISEFSRVMASFQGQFTFVFLATSDNKNAIDEIANENMINLAGETEIADIFFLLKEYALAFMGVDSALLHIASLLDIPTVGIFGPTSPVLYGPFSQKHIVVHSQVQCSPCMQSACSESAQRCIREILPEQLSSALRKICA